MMVNLESRRHKKILTSVFIISFISFLCLIFGAKPVYAADEEPTTSPPRNQLVVSGLGASDATITDGNGNPVSPDDPYHSWNNYDVSYNWSIPDDIPVVTGDTVTFELPSQVKITANMMGMPVYNSNGELIGSFSIDAGSNTGTITFNDALAGTSTGRRGTLHIMANGANSNAVDPGNQNWAINKVGWLSDYTPTGLPKYVVWNVAFNPNEQHLTNVVVTDQLGPGQTYVEGSVNAPTGAYNENGTFIPDGGSLSPQVTVDANNQIKFNFGTVDTAVDMTFRVLIDANIDGANKWTDNATLTSDQLNGNTSAEVSWGGFGTGEGSQKPLGSVLLQKTDADGKALTGAAYELKDSAGNVLMSEVSVDANGQLTIHDLPVDSYTLTEIKAPAGYDLNPDPIHFSIAQQGTETEIPAVDLTQVDQKTVPQVGSVLFNKTSATTLKGLPGAVYTLLDAEGNELQTGLTTDENGQIKLTDLDPGNYAFKETQAPDGYALATENVPFTVTANNTVTVGQADELKPVPLSKIVVTKVDAKTNQPLAGAVYQLTDAKGTVIQDNLVTDEKGQVTINDLADGTYTLTEIKAPDGYLLATTPTTINIAVENGTIYPINLKDDPEPEVPTVGDVLFNKTSATTLKGLPGAEYALLDAAGNELQTGLITDENGQINLPNLAPGDYAFKETKAPEGYALATVLVPFTVTAGKTVTVGQADELKPAPLSKIVITKVDAKTNQPLAGAIYQLTDAKGVVLNDNLVTDEKGQVTINDLADGTYTLTEIKAPAGYQLASKPTTITVENGNVYPVEFKDEPEAEVPGEPEVPTNPEIPTNPEVPGEPEVPTNPEIPTNPEVPTNPEIPTNPEVPGEPEVPTNPEIPTNPEVPGEPGLPTYPEAPIEPEIPLNPEEEQNAPEFPIAPGTPGVTNQPTATTPATPTAPAKTPDVGGTDTGQAVARFPQTGSKQEPYLEIIGVALVLAFGIGLTIKRRYPKA